MDVAQTITAILGVGGGGVLIGQFVRWLMKRADGSSSRERIRNTDLTMRRVRAEESAELADRKRRRAMEEIARLRVLAIEHHIDPGPEVDFDKITLSRRGRPTKERK